MGMAWNAGKGLGLTSALMLVGVQACSSSPKGAAPSTKTTPSTGTDASVTPDASTGMDASTTQNVSNDGGLDVVTASNVGDGGSISIGPAGGHLVFTNGVILDVPAGALSQIVTVSATLLTTVPSIADINPSQFVSAVQLLPDGLDFAEPVTLTMPFPLGTPTTGLVVVALEEPTTGDDAGATGDDSGTEQDDAGEDAESTVDQLQEDSPLSEDDPILQTGATSVQVQITHFSLHILVQIASGMRVLSDLTSDLTATADTEKLSKQIIDVWAMQSSLAPEALPTSYAGLLLPPNSAYLQPSAWADLQKAADNAGSIVALAPLRARIQANYVWRSLATQYVLANASPAGSAVADVGGSNHGPGDAIDVALPLGKAGANAKCLQILTANRAAGMPRTDAVMRGIMDIVSPGVGELLLQNNWVWWGLFQSENNQSDAWVCRDSVHFEHRNLTPPYAPIDANTVATLRAHVQAFQTLWNNNNPCFKIPDTEFGVAPVVDGSITDQALAQSPVAGFPLETPALMPPATGKMGAGCQTNINPTADGPICCPDSTAMSGYSCQTSCGCGANVPDGGACNSITSIGPMVAPTCSTAAPTFTTTTPPMATGGTIVDGTYVMTSDTLYEDDACDAMAAEECSADLGMNPQEWGTLILAGTCLQIGSNETNSSYTFAVAGNQLTSTGTCGNSVGSSGSQPFSATPTTLTLFDFDTCSGAGQLTQFVSEIQVFTKQ